LLAAAPTKLGKLARNALRFISDSRMSTDRLTARSVAWCSASIWSAPDGAGLLTLDASSIQTDQAGTRRIAWMINRMIKLMGYRVQQFLVGWSAIRSGEMRQEVGSHDRRLTRAALPPAQVLSVST
jgi:hypothetical protein